MKFIFGILLGAAVCALSIFLLSGPKEKIRLSGPSTSLVVYLVKENDADGSSRFSVHRSNEKLFSVHVVSNAFFIRIREHDLPLDEIVLTEHQQDGQTTRKIRTVIWDSNYDWRAMEFDLTKGQIEKVVVSTGGKVEVSDAKDNPIDIRSEQSH